MMQFRIVKEALVKTLGDQAACRFRVIGYQRQSKSTDELTGNNRLVQCYYSDGDFKKGAGKMRGPKMHDITIDINVSASAKAQCDVTILDSPAATQSQKAQALADLKYAAELADQSVDETIDAVYQIIMDARNEYLGLEKDALSSRWLDRVQKDTIIERGDLVVKTANMKYSCRVQEDVAGEIGNEPDTVIFNSELPVDDTEGAGVTVENDNTED